MFLNSRVVCFAKKGCKAFLASAILVSSCFIYIFGNPSTILNILETEEPQILNYQPPPRRPFQTEMLRDSFFSCFMGGNGASQLKNISSVDELQDSRLFSHLQEFGSVMASLGVTTAIIEPSVLFCMLSEQHAAMLQKRYIVPSMSNNIFNLAVDAYSAAILETSEAKKIVRSNGYRAEFVKRPRPDWMPMNTSAFVGHIFLRQERADLVFHLVVFHKRGDFIWHSSMLAGEANGTLGTHFVGHDAAYENFSMISLEFASPQLTNLSIPSDPQFFLFEISTSQFLECNETVVSEYMGIASNSLPARHNKWMSIDRFDRRAAISLREVKSVFNPLLMRFWIWSGTMLGWYRQCGIISYTSDVDFAADASQLEDLETLMKALGKSEHLKIKEKMGMPSKGLEFNLAVHWLRVDIFFVYGEKNGTWYAGHRPSRKYYFKYHHPFFTLCSTELLGQKVQVPCQTEEVIRTEYGPNWIHPVSGWNYETSIFNRGPNINWTAEELAQGVYTDEF